MKIALIDDDVEFLKIEKQLVEDVFFDYIEIDTYTNANAFLSNAKINKYFAVFLDIDMPEVSGFELASYLRKNNPDDINIVFVSNKEQLVYDSFNYFPVRFIRKEFAKSEIKQTLQTLYEKFQTLNKFISIKVNFDYQKISLNDIYYLESFSHNIKLHTKNDVIIYRDKISNKEKELENLNFIRTHSGFLVNLKYINCIIKNNVVLDNNVCIPISRSRLETVKSRFQNYLRLSL